MGSPTMEFRRTLAGRLKEARGKSQLMAKQITSRVGVDSGTLSQWESGKRVPSAWHLVRLAEVYGVSVGWLLGKE